jgi:hypothetical protein
MSIFLITILILIFKDNYFIQWLTFLTGLVGGFGLNELFKKLAKEPKITNTLQDDEEKQ